MRKGLIISEYPPGTKPTPYQFPQRNRIIAGLVKAIVIVEASSASGSLITAELGENLGKDIYALPGNITSPWSLGTNKLIADGAIPLVVIEDIIRDLGGSISPAADEVEQLSKAEREILITLKQEGEVSMEELCHILQKSPTEIGGIVAVLEIKGFVAYHFGKIFLAK